MLEHWFWSLMLVAVLIWYSTITIYVGIRGMRDIRGMLRRLKADDQDQEAKNE